MEPAVQAALIAAGAAIIVALLNRRHGKVLGEINRAVNNVDKTEDARPLWQRIDEQTARIGDLADGVSEIRSTQKTTLLVLDAVIDRRAGDHKKIRELNESLAEVADLKDVIRGVSTTSGP